MLRGSSLSREFSSSNLSHHLEDPDSDVLYYIVLRAVDQYVSQYNCQPGECTLDDEDDDTQDHDHEDDTHDYDDDTNDTHDHNDISPGLTEADIELDIGRLKTIITGVLTQTGVGASVQGLDEHIHEVRSLVTTTSSLSS